MEIREFVDAIGGEFYTGVPDSQLKALCNYLINTYGVGEKHLIAANEGNAVGLAAGHYLATGEIPVVYMQNSGIGNMMNPYASLMQEEVYGIPCIFVIGWRGEPGIQDEPQHIFQGKTTLPLLSDMEIDFFIVDKGTTVEKLKEKAEEFQRELDEGRSVAYVVKKGSLLYDEKVIYKNEYTMRREDVLKIITKYSENDVVISTTGKISRELFEIREEEDKNHARDFLTVGSMGHSSSIALKIALEKKNRRIWCIDGDGAMLMHLGAMAVVGSMAPENFVHIVMNNEAHETVGGMPTVGKNIEFTEIARACGYRRVESVRDFLALEGILESVRADRELTFIEVKCGLGSRENLGRPTTTPKENRDCFMKFLQD